MAKSIRVGVKVNYVRRNHQRGTGKVTALQQGVNGQYVVVKVEDGTESKFRPCNITVL